jgi:hypothetical protein
MGCPFIECSAKSSFNINRLFHKILVEINKYENNVDLRKLGCKKLFEFFIKNGTILLAIFYIFMMINMTLAVVFVCFGFINGIKGKVKETDNIHVGTRLFFGFWNFLFSFVGFYGICKRKKDYINYVYSN